MNLNFRPSALLLIEELLTSLMGADALDGRHAHQVGGTYGAIQVALLKALEVELTSIQGYALDHATEVARILYSSAIRNGENIAYQVDLLNDGMI